LSSLDSVLIVPFWKSLRNNDFSKVADTLEEFEQMKDEYFKQRDSSQERSSLAKGFKTMINNAKINSLARTIDLLPLLFLSKSVVPESEYNKILLGIYSKLNKDIHKGLNLQLEDELKLVLEKLDAVKEGFIMLYANDNATAEDKECSILAELAQVEHILNRSLGDINKIVVSQWLEYEKTAKSIIKSNGN